MRKALHTAQLRACLHNEVLKMPENAVHIAVTVTVRSADDLTLQLYLPCLRSSPSSLLLIAKAPAVENFAWLPVGLAPTKSARGSVSLI